MVNKTQLKEVRYVAEFGANVKARREAMKMSQKGLAEKLGVRHVTVCKWETGAMYPSADRIPTIADALSCTIDALYGRDWPRKRSVS